MIIQTVNHFAHTVYDIEFEDGKLVSIRYWNYPTHTDIYRLNRSDDNPILHHFEDAIATLCHDHSINTFSNLYEAVRNDEECTSIVQKVLDRELMYMSKQVSLIASANFQKHLNK